MYKFGIRALANEPEKNKEIISFFERLGYCNEIGFNGDVGNSYNAVYVVGDSSNKIHCCVAPIVELLFDNVKEAKEYINKHKEVMNKEIKIEIPEGYEIDMENNTFECIKFKKKELTYRNIARELFFDKNSWYINDHGYVTPCKAFETYSGRSNYNNCTSEEQAEKLLAINKLMNVAKYLNNGWKPNWSDDNEKKYYIGIDNRISDNHEIIVGYNYVVTNSLICFKTEKLAREAIRILGEDTIRLAYSTDY